MIPLYCRRTVFLTLLAATTSTPAAHTSSGANARRHTASLVRPLKKVFCSFCGEILCCLPRCAARFLHRHQRTLATYNLAHTISLGKTEVAREKLQCDPQYYYNNRYSIRCLLEAVEQDHKGLVLLMLDNGWDIYAPDVTAKPIRANALATALFRQSWNCLPPILRHDAEKHVAQKNKLKLYAASGTPARFLLDVLNASDMQDVWTYCDETYAAWNCEHTIHGPFPYATTQGTLRSAAPQTSPQNRAYNFEKLTRWCRLSVIDYLIRSRATRELGDLLRCAHMTREEWKSLGIYGYHLLNASEKETMKKTRSRIFRSALVAYTRAFRTLPRTKALCHDPITHIMAYLTPGDFVPQATTQPAQ